jgi:L-lactate dehydrogenase complex protein LldG
MFDPFKARAEAARAEVFRFSTKPAALDFLLAFLAKEGLSDQTQSVAVWAECPFLEATDRQRLAAIAGIRFDVSRELAAEAKFGISQMEWALADTGTLVQDSAAIAQRLVSSLPSIHIALVPTSGILADLPALLSRVSPQKSGYIALITGPSRTADIERVLTIGVHGPERLLILFVDDLGVPA